MALVSKLFVRIRQAKKIERAFDGGEILDRNVEILHRRHDAAVPQQTLDGGQSRARLKQVSGEAVAIMPSSAKSHYRPL